MAWKISAAKRRALVKLQLRDSKGRWIEMGGEVEWFSSKLNKKLSGTVIGQEGNSILVQLPKENPTHEPAPIKVPARTVTNLYNKAMLPDADGSDAPGTTKNGEADDTSDAPGTTKNAPPAENADISDGGDGPEAYEIGETEDGFVYFGRKDDQELYSSARDLQVGDELIAPDGTDERKPYSIGRNWQKRGVERVAKDGIGIGKVVKVEENRYAIVELPEGVTVPDEKNGGEKNTVTVGLANSVIKATDGLKAKLEPLMGKRDESSESEPQEEPMNEPQEGSESGSEATEPTEAPSTDVTSREELEDALEDLQTSMDNIDEAGIEGEELLSAQEEAAHAVRSDAGDEYTLGIEKDEAGDWTINLLDDEGGNVQSWPVGSESSDEIAADIDGRINRKAKSAAPTKKEKEPVEAKSEPKEKASHRSQLLSLPRQLSAELNDKGLTEEEQSDVDTYTRMAKRAADKFDFDKEESYLAKVDEILARGQERLGSDEIEESDTENEPVAEPVEAPEPAADPEPAESEEDQEPWGDPDIYFMEPSARTRIRNLTDTVGKDAMGFEMDEEKMLLKDPVRAESTLRSLRDAVAKAEQESSRRPPAVKQALFRARRDFDSALDKLNRHMADDEPTEGVETTLTRDPEPVSTPEPAPAPEPVEAPEPAEAASTLPAGIKRWAREALPEEKYAPTEQQQEVIDAVLGGLDTVIQAKAGAGKTSTLEAIARRLQAFKPESAETVYVAFNTTVAEEARKRMPSNVTAKTGHAIARAAATPWMLNRMTDTPNKAHGLKKGRTAVALRNPKDIAAHLGIKKTMQTSGEPLDAADQARLANKIVDTYANSADDTISYKNLPEDAPTDLNDEQIATLVGYANQIWDDINDPDGVMRYTQDHNRKIWALSRPDFSKDGKGLKAAKVLFIDEAQDTPPVLAKVIEDQTIQKVIVGDADQAIYGFTGATDYLSKAAKDIELPLTKSWRFGPEIADWGNRFLQLVGSKQRVEGGGPSSTVLPEGQTMENPDAILVRTNSGMMKEIVGQLAAGRVVGVPSRTKENLQKVFNHAGALYKGERPFGNNFHEDLGAYKTWAEFKAAAEKGEDRQAVMYNNLIKEHGIGGLLELLKQVVDPYEEGQREWMANSATSKGSVLKNVKFENIGGQIAASGDTYKLNQLVKAHGKRMGEFGFKWNKDKKVWTAPSDQAEANLREWLETVEASEEGGEIAIPDIKIPEVTVSTAHKSKGLEWGRVKIGDDFFAPKEDPTTGKEIPPSDEELRLAYVAVTRAEKELDPGSLRWISEPRWSDPNGGDPNSTRESEPTEAEPVATPEPVEAEPEPEPIETPEPVEVEPTEPVSAPEPVETDPEPVEAEPEPVETDPEPEPVEVEPEPVVEPVEVEPTTEPEPVEPVSEPEPVEAEPVSTTTGGEKETYNENGLTPSEQARLDELEQQIAQIYRGISDGDVEPLENEVNDLYELGEARLAAMANGTDPSSVTPPEPTVAPVKPAEPTNSGGGSEGASEPTTPSGRRRRRSTSELEPVISANGKEIQIGDTVTHPKYSGVVERLNAGAGSAVVRTTDGQLKTALGKKLTVGDGEEEPVAAPVAVNQPIGWAGIDPVSGKLAFVGSDGKTIGIGDKVVNPRKGSGTVKAIYPGATSVLVEWDDETHKPSRVQTKALASTGESEGSSEPVESEPTEVEPVSAPVSEPEPTDIPTGSNGEPVFPDGDPITLDFEEYYSVFAKAATVGTVLTQKMEGTDLVFRQMKEEDGSWSHVDENGNFNELGGGFAEPIYRPKYDTFVKWNLEGAKDRRVADTPVDGFLDNLPIGSTVTVRRAAGDEIYTKMGPGFWKSDTPSEWDDGYLPYVTQFAVGSFPLVDFRTPGSQEANWEPKVVEGSEMIVGGEGEKRIQVFRLPQGSVVADPVYSEKEYVKEGNFWKEELRGVRTGVELGNLNKMTGLGMPIRVRRAEVEARPIAPAVIDSKRVIGDPAELDKIFNAGIEEYEGVENVFRTYKSEEGQFNPLAPNAEPMKMTLFPPEGGVEKVTEVTNSSGDRFALGSKVYSKADGSFLGMVFGMDYSREGTKRFTVKWAKDSTLYTDGEIGGRGWSQMPQRFNIDDYTTTPPRKWDTSADLDFSDYKTVGQINKKMEETYPGFYMKMAPRLTDIDTAKEMAATVSRLFNKYPMLAENMQSVSAERFKGRHANANAAAHSYGPAMEREGGGKVQFVGTQVGFNINNSRAGFIWGKRESVRTRWNNQVDEGREVEATTTHEFGHVIDFLTGNIDEMTTLQFISQILGRDVKENSEELRRELFDNHQLSEYSTIRGTGVNPVELVAESFQDVEMNGALAKPLSKLVHQELMKRLAKFGLPSVEYGSGDDSSGGPNNGPDGGGAAPFDFGVRSRLSGGKSFGEMLRENGIPESLEDRKILEASFDKLASRITDQMPEGVTASVYRLDWNRADLDVIINWEKDGKVVGSMYRNFELGWDPYTKTEKPLVRQQKIVITDPFQGQGIATVALKESEELYKQLGLEQILLEANIDVGGYAWARAGFNWHGFATMEDLVERIERRIRLGYIEPTPEELSQFRALAKRATEENWRNGTAPTPFEFSQIGYNGTDSWIGKQMMLGSKWNGVKEIV